MYVCVCVCVIQSSHIVIRIENSGYVLCEVLVQHCLYVVSMIDWCKGEGERREERGRSN